MSTAPVGLSRCVVEPGPPRLIGRETDLETVRELLDRHRLVTVTGAGGVGKTRLAWAVAGSLPEVGPASTAVVVCELADADAPDAVRHVVTDRLGVRVPNGVPVGAALPRSGDTGRLLVVLDNCEHVVDAAAELAAWWAGAARVPGRGARIRGPAGRVSGPQARHRPAGGLRRTGPVGHRRRPVCRRVGRNYPRRHNLRVPGQSPRLVALEPSGPAPHRRQSRGECRSRSGSGRRSRRGRRRHCSRTGPDRRQRHPGRAGPGRPRGGLPDPPGRPGLRPQAAPLVRQRLRGDVPPGSCPAGQRSAPRCGQGPRGRYGR